MSALAASVFFRSSKIHNLAGAGGCGVFFKELETVLKFWHDPFTKEHAMALAEIAVVAANWGFKYVEVRLKKLAARRGDLGKDIGDYYYCIVTPRAYLGPNHPDLVEAQSRACPFPIGESLTGRALTRPLNSAW